MTNPVAVSVQQLVFPFRRCCCCSLRQEEGRERLRRSFWLQDGGTAAPRMQHGLEKSLGTPHIAGHHAWRKKRRKKKHNRSPEYIGSLLRPLMHQPLPLSAHWPAYASTGPPPPSLHLHDPRARWRVSVNTSRGCGAVSRACMRAECIHMRERGVDWRYRKQRSSKGDAGCSWSCCRGDNQGFPPTEVSNKPLLIYIQSKD